MLKDLDEEDDNLVNEPPRKRRRKNASGDITEIVTDFVVNDLQPFSIVESPNFSKLVRSLVGSPVTLPSRKTISKSVKQRFDIHKDRIKSLLATVVTICLTADCWSSHHRYANSNIFTLKHKFSMNKSYRGFMGVTGHWIDEKLTRKSCALACKRIKDRHTFDILARNISCIIEDYDLAGKVSYVITDSGSNFIKAFRYETSE